MHTARYVCANKRYHFTTCTDATSAQTRAEAALESSRARRAVAESELTRAEAALDAAARSLQYVNAAFQTAQVIVPTRRLR